MSDEIDLDKEIREILERGQAGRGVPLIQSNIIIGNRGVVIIGGDCSVQQHTPAQDQQDTADKRRAS